MKKFIKFNMIFIFFILLIGSVYQVFAAEDIEIKISSTQKEFTNSDIILVIEVNTNKPIEEGSNVAVQILLGEETSTNTWIDLGSGTNISILKKSYNYIIKKNEKISIRAIKWKLPDKSDLQQLAIKTYDVSNIDKTEPIIENIDSEISENTIILNIIAKDIESGIANYTCSCEAINYNQTSENSKFELNNLEANKEYEVSIIVTDKVGNKKEERKKVIVQTNSISTQNSITPDSTTANKIIPEIGKSNFSFIIIWLIFALTLILIKIIYKNKR